MVLTPFRMGVKFYRDLLPSLTPEIWHALTSPGSSAYHPLWKPLIICEMLLNGALFVFTLWLLWLFFKTSKRVPKLMVIWFASIAAIQIIDHMLVAQIPAAASQPLDPATIKDWIRSLIGAAIWIPYFLKSKRVRNTFGNPVS